jgi:small subunit ribosomal protein S17
MPRRILQGTIVSNKNNKTLVVRVERKVMPPLYKKYVRKSKKFHAHYENTLLNFSIGEKVKIRECKPVSKLKCWEIFIQ